MSDVPATAWVLAAMLLAAASETQPERGGPGGRGPRCRRPGPPHERPGRAPARAGAPAEKKGLSGGGGRIPHCRVPPAYNLTAFGRAVETGYGRCSPGRCLRTSRRISGITATGSGLADPAGAARLDPASPSTAASRCRPGLLLLWFAVFLGVLLSSTRLRRLVVRPVPSAGDARHDSGGALLARAASPTASRSGLRRPVPAGRLTLREPSSLRMWSPASGTCGGSTSSRLRRAKRSTGDASNGRNGPCRVVPSCLHADERRLEVLHRPPIADGTASPPNDFRGFAMPFGNADSLVRAPRPFEKATARKNLPGNWTADRQRSETSSSGDSTSGRSVPQSAAVSTS